MTFLLLCYLVPLLVFNYSPLWYLIDLDKIKEKVVAKEARITKLEEECQAKDRSIEYVTTMHKEVIETFCGYHGDMLMILV